VGHQDGDRLTLAEDAGDVVGRAVGVGRVGNVPVGVAVAEEHAVVGDEVGVGPPRRSRSALAVRDGDLDHVALVVGGGPGVSARSTTRRWTGSHWNRAEALVVNAPG